MGARPVRLLKRAGTALAAVSLVFVAALLWREREALAAFRPGPGGLGVLALCVLAYTLLGWVLAAAWRHLLIWTGEASVHAAATRRIYSQTQIAKYIPGNVAQFAGRQVIGRQEGWSHVGLLLSTVFELLSLVAVGAAMAAVSILFGAHVLVDSNALAWSVAAGLILTGLAVPAVGSRLLQRRWPDAAQRVAGLRLARLWPALACHLVFFVTAATILVSVTSVVIGGPLPWGHWPAIGGLFAVAWLVSTLTPGAPSGIGIREVVLVAGLASVTTTGNAILVATLLRVVTVSGDLGFFLLAGTGRRLRSPAG